MAVRHIVAVGLDRSRSCLDRLAAEDDQTSVSRHLRLGRFERGLSARRGETRTREHPNPFPLARIRLAAGGREWDGARVATRALRAVRAPGLPSACCAAAASYCSWGGALRHLGARRVYPIYERHDMTATNALRSFCVVALALLVSVLLPQVGAARAYTVRTLTAASG